MPKFELGDALAAALKNVPDKVNSAAGGREGPLAGTSPSGAASPAGGENSQKHEQIEYIDLTAIDSDGNNFYSLDGIDALAANIELVGLQQPLRVRRNPDFAGRYILVSGHRRRAALGVLAGEGQERFQKVPCIVEEPEGSAALQELKLIYANSDTRKMSDADLSKQAERVEALLYQLKEEGYDFPGRMRDYVAEACKVSKTKLSTLKVIREKLPEQYRAAFESGRMSTEAAYHVARAPADLQEKICKAFKKEPTAKQVERLAEAQANAGYNWEVSLTCPDGKPCSHGAAFLRHDADGAWGACGGKTCCLSCEKALCDWSPCGSACARAKEKRSEQNAEKKAAQEMEREKQRRKLLREISKSAKRLLPAIDRAGLADETDTGITCHSRGIPCSRFMIGEIRAAARGEFRDGFNPYYDPFSFEPSRTEGELAALLGCTLDFLYGRTENPAPSGAAKWVPGNQPPEKDCDAVCVFGFEDGAKLMQLASWRFERWNFYLMGGVGASIVAECLRWFPLPGVDADLM